MNHARVLYQLARADFLERARRHSFLLMLGFTLYFGYLTAAGYVDLRLSHYRGIFNSAWTGVLMALVASCFLTLTGFYFVKNTIERDRETGVGQILAATPVSKMLYILGKALSNFLVLVAMVSLLIPVGIVTQHLRGEESRIQLWPLVAPFLLLVLPAMSVVAALAVLFETVPGLRGGLGNVLYFFLWSSFPAVAIVTKHSFFDVWGLMAVWESTSAAAHAHFHDYVNGFSFNVSNTPAPATGVQLFPWEGLTWTPEILLARLFWIAVSLGLVLLAAAIFDRFDPSRVSRRAAVEEPSEEPAPESRPVTAPAPVHLESLPADAVHFRFTQMVVGELRLMLKGRKWWWYLIAAGLFIGCVASPPSMGLQFFLPFAWLWPILIWSAMGTREARFQTNQLVFSAPHNLRRQLPALWLAGVIVALLTGAGVAVRLLFASDWRTLFGWLVGAIFIPTLALACGTLTGNSKLFEIIYTLMWYVGPMHAQKELDFMAASRATVAAAIPKFYLLAALVLFLVALLARRRQLQT